jgi:hypothetical protein
LPPQPRLRAAACRAPAGVTRARSRASGGRIGLCSRSSDSNRMMARLRGSNSHKSVQQLACREVCAEEDVRESPSVHDARLQIGTDANLIRETMHSRGLWTRRSPTIDAICDRQLS